MNRHIEQDCVRWEEDDGKLLFSITETLSGETVTLSLSGTLSSVVAPAFEDELMGAACVRSRIAVDFSGLQVISSGGLKALLTVQRLLDQRPGSMLKLCAMSSAVHATFAEIGFDELFEIEN